ncbi:DUF4365 domain-containing protein [Aeromonas caviae]|uniref:DUF4365 domain-containing protein n=1 Tax=Aeromonas caviae TaxID=648 RepID=UPI002B472B2B|nr:DUF4365 domain-containing protein [Aeromonas caviae]
MTSRAGVYFSGYALSMSGMIFRETSSSDVGIDGQIELVNDDGSATGMLIGVQIKSGDSFVNHKQKKFTFTSSREHYKYWSRLIMPTIGIVFSPKLETASWFVLDSHYKDILERDASCSITQKLHASNELSINCDPLPYISMYIRQYYESPITQDIIDRFDSLRNEESDAFNEMEKMIAWSKMIAAFFSLKSKPEIICDIGYRLSWYFPSVTERQREIFKTRINKMSEPELYNIFKGIKLALKNDYEKTFELIMDLLRYKNNILDMLSALQKSNLPNRNEKKQIMFLIEYVEQF